jgi:predicted esterase
MLPRALLESSAKAGGLLPLVRQTARFSIVPALLALASLTACSDEPDATSGPTTSTGWPSTADSGVPIGTSGGVGGVTGAGSLAGTGSLGGTGTGVFGGTIGPGAPTAGGVAAGGVAAGGIAAGGIAAGGGSFGGGSFGGAAAGTAGATGGVLAGLAGALGGSGGTAAGIIGGLLGGSGGTAAGTLGGIIGGLTGGGMMGGGEPIDPSAKQPAASKLPTVSGPCPSFRNGVETVGGLQVQFWAGSGQKGALVFYFHGTGGSAGEAEALFGVGTGGLTGVISQITAAGGIVASFENTTGGGNPLEYGVWATDDFKVVDQIVACAIQANRIDPGRIHALGFSAGGLAAGGIYYLRSNYLASVVTYSGGMSPWPGNDVRQDPQNKLPALMFHGGDSDWVILGFKDQSIQMATEMKGKGATAYLCDHGGGHAIPADGPAGAWAFFKAHPYNTVPASFAGMPRYCTKF